MVRGRNTGCGVALCALVVWAFFLLGPGTASAGTWAQPNGGDINGSVSGERTFRISGSETEEPMGTMATVPWANLVGCLVFGSFSTWHSEHDFAQFNGTNSWPTTQQHQEGWLTTPCAFGFSWGNNHVRDADIDAEGGGTPWMLRVGSNAVNNLVASWRNGSNVWTKEVLPASGGARDRGSIDSEGAYVAVSSVHAGNELEVHWRIAPDSWVQLPNISVGSPTDINADIAWVGSEPWVVSSHKITNGRLYVHRYNGTSWVQVGTGPLNQNAGSGDVTSVAIANDAGNQPYISFVESGQTYLKQWNGSAWVLIGGGSLGAAATTDVTVNRRVDLPYVAYGGTGGTGTKVRMWTGSSWRGPVQTDTSTTWASTSIAIGMGKLWVGSLTAGESARAYRYTMDTPNAPSTTSPPPALSGNNTPTLNLAGTFSGDTMALHWRNQWQVRTDPGAWALYDSGEAATSNSHTTTPLPDGVYCYRVRWADQQTTWGAWSAEHCGFAIDTTPPPSPATRRDGTGVDIAWTNSATQLSANWSAVTDNLSGLKHYEYCVSTSSSGADCAGAAVIPWTVTAATSFTRTGLTLTQGAAYYTCIIARDNMDYPSTKVCTNGQRVDSINPTAPLVVAPTGYGIGTPNLQATYTDVAPGSPGDVYFQICPTAACSSQLQTGWSAAGIAVGGAATFSPTALATGTYHWRAYGRDSAGNTGPYSAAQSFTVNYLPSAPTGLTPASGAWTNDVEPIFQAQFVDVGDTGSVRFELCASNAANPWVSTCGSSYRTVDSGTGLPSGSAGWASFNSAFPDGTYYWRARNVDSYGELSGWTAANVVNIDTTKPTTPVVQHVRPSGAGRITITHTASTDSGSGSVFYESNYSTNGGAGWNPGCSGITATECEVSGLANLIPVLMRVRACDAAGNCTNWQTGAGATGQPYYPRTDDPSALLTTSAQVQEATLGTGTNNTNTRIQYANGWTTSQTGWWTVQPNANNTTRLTTAPAEPINANPGRGWVIDAVAGKSVAAGDVMVEVTTDSNHAGDTGHLECRAYVIRTNGTAILSSTPIGTTGITSGDVLDGASGVRRTCAPGGLPAQIPLDGDQGIYVELVLRITAAGVYTWGNNILSLRMNNTQSAITIPGSGTFPNAPTPVSPAPGATTTLTPTLRAQYSHPTPVNGTLQFEVATDAAFTSIVQTGASIQLSNGQNGQFVVGTLQPSTTYYWRARAVDNVGLQSGTTAPQSFTTTAPPATPTNAAPGHTAIVRTGTPVLTSSAFSDPDVGDTHAQSQWEIRTQLGSYGASVHDVTSGTDLTSHPAAGLTNGEAYCWRVRHGDANGVWSAWSSDTCFTYDTTGGSITVSLDLPTVALPSLTANSDGTGLSIITIASRNATGYTLNATDASDTTALAGPANIPDWTGTSASPTAWSAGTGPYFGLTVLGVTGTTTSKLAKWGIGTLPSDFVNNRYAGLRNSSNVVLHSRSSFSLLPDLVTVGYRFSTGTTPAGAYSGGVTYTVIPNP